ncbi:MAG: hypothetical protein RR413_10285 [Christensenellaceae bacterium]
MSYLMEIQQGETRNIVGIFATLENADNFLTSIPFIIKRNESYGITYTIPFADLPELYVAAYHNWRYVFSRCSYEPERDNDEIEIVLTELSQMDTATSEIAFPKGYTSVDAYTFPNDEIQREVEKRIALFKEAEVYFGRQGRRVERGGLGSQDGEYVLVSDENNPKQMHITFLLEPQSIQAREKAKSFEDFLRMVNE